MYMVIEQEAMNRSWEEMKSPSLVVSEMSGHSPEQYNLIRHPLSSGLGLDDLQQFLLTGIFYEPLVRFILHYIKIFF